MSDREAHSELGASNAFRWINCPASVELSRGCPNESSEAAKEGTAAHALLELCLSNGEVSAGDYLGIKVPPDAPAADQFEVTREMVAGVNVFLDFAWNLAAGTGAEYLVETKFALPEPQYPPGMFGRCDLCVIDDDALHVVDFKYGAGKAVEVAGLEYAPDIAKVLEAAGLLGLENPQPIYYGLGAYWSLPDAVRQRITWFHLHIVQPRIPHAAGPVRSIRLCIDEMLMWGGRLAAFARETANPGCKFRTGEWCRFCPAAGSKCTVLKTVATAAATDAFGAIADPATFDAAELGDRLRAAEALRTYLKRLDEQAELSAKAGRMPSGFKWVHGRGSRAWKMGASDIGYYVLEKTGRSIIETAVLSVAEAEKALGKKDFALLADLIDKKQGALKLVPESDPKPAVNPQDAKTSAFNAV